MSELIHRQARGALDFQRTKSFDFHLPTYDSDPKEYIKTDDLNRFLAILAAAFDFDIDYLDDFYIKYYSKHVRGESYLIDLNNAKFLRGTSALLLNVKGMHFVGKEDAKISIIKVRKYPEEITYFIAKDHRTEKLYLSEDLKSSDVSIRIMSASHYG